MLVGVVVAAIAASGLGTVAVPPAGAVATVTHVDCAAPPGGTPDGSLANPYTSLAQVNALMFNAGDQLLFKRGSVCTGMLAPRGSGTVAAPWVIDDYGTGSGRARIDGAGSVESAVLLRNVEGVAVRDLELTNGGTEGPARRGLHVLLNDFGEGEYYRVENLYVHDVAGNNNRGAWASNGIHLSVVGDVRASNFHDVRIQGNVVANTMFGGIVVGASEWGQRPESGTTVITKPWTPHTDVRVEGNLVTSAGGDGIVTAVTAGAVVERNHVVGFHLRHPVLPHENYGGIWTINSNDTVIQFNNVTGGQTTDDGMAFDTDIGTIRTRIQYNYSANNEGGFLLICPDPKDDGSVVRDAVIRYNVSQNDEERGVLLCRGRIETTRVHNNTIYVGPGRSMAVVDDQGDASRDIRFENNVVVKEGDGAAWVRISPGSRLTLATNAMANVLGDPAAGVDARLMARGTATSLDTIDGYRLHASSPAIGAATPVPGNGGRDIFGNSVPATGPANIGADEGAGVTGTSPPALQPPGANLVTNGGFETGTLTPWASSNGSVSTLAHTGSFAGQVSSPSSGGYLQQTVGGLTPGARYVVSGWITSDDRPTILGAKSFGGAEVSRVVTARTWTHQPVTFTVGSGSSSAVVYCYRPEPGTGRCDDMSLVRIG